MVFEPYKSYNPFDSHTFGPSTFILTNNDFTLEELAFSFEFVTGISLKAFAQFQQDTNRTLYIDDIIKIVSVDDD